MDVESGMVWIDGQGVSQCEVPRLCFSFVKVPAFIGLVFASLLAVVACGIVGTLYLMLPEEMASMTFFVVCCWFLCSVFFAHHCIRALEITTDFIWFKADCDR